MIENVPKNGWNEWAKYVLNTLEDLKKGNETLGEAIQKIEIALKVLETRITQRAALTGGLVGFITTLVLGLLVYFLSKGKYV